MTVSPPTKGPSPQTTLVILLGASAWPLSPAFQSSRAFANAAQRLKAYFLNSRPFGLPQENFLDLFDSEKNADELDECMSQYLEQRLAAMRKAGNEARDLIVYFIGHGGFVGHDADLYLAIRRTRMSNPRASGIYMLALADTLREKARYLRRILVLDCCFAAAAFSAFQSGPDQVAVQKTVTAFLVDSKAVGFPTRGTSLLCSSNHQSPSLLLPDNSSTMFTKAFLDALIQGMPSRRSRLSLRDVKDIATDRLYEMQNAPRPVVLSPDQSEGDIADLPFFPNPRVEQIPGAEEETRAGQVKREYPTTVGKKYVEEPDGNPPQSPRIPPATLRRFIPHPWLLGMCLLSFLLIILVSTLAPSLNSSSPFLVLLSVLLGLVWFETWISSTVIAAQERHWAWFIVLLLTFGAGVFFFSIFDQPKKLHMLASPANKS